MKKWHKNPTSLSLINKIAANKILLILILSIIGLILYAHSFDNKFLLDDTVSFSETSFFNQIHWNKIFSTPYIPREGRYYRPVATLLFKLEYTLFRDNLFPYHLLNLILHIINSYLVFIAMQVLSKNNKLSLLSSFLFLIHPFSAETVLTLIASSDMTGFLFLFMAIIFWLKNYETKNYIYRILVLTCFTLALFTKETNLILLPLLIYIDICKAGFKNALKSYRKYILLFLIMVGFLIIRSQVLSANKSIPIKHITFYLFPRLISSLWLYIKYLGQLILPVNICSNIMTPIDVNFLNWRFFITIAFLILVTFIYVVAFRKRNILLLFSSGYIFITILPSCNITPLYPFLIINNTPYLYHVPRHLYLPSIGCFILLGYILTKRTSTEILSILFIIIFSFATLQKVFEYNNPINFYSSITKRCPDNFWGHCFLAASYRSNGQLKEALSEIKKALTLQPQHHDIHKKAADIYGDLGDYRNALRQYRISIKLNPNDYETYQNMGITYNTFKHYEKAIKASYHAIQLCPTCTKAYNNLGNVYFQMNKIPEAERFLEKALELNPVDAEAFFNLGTIYMKQHMFSLAIDMFEKSLRIDPEFYSLYPQLAECYAKVNDLPKAVSAFKAYLKYFPHDHGIWNNLGICYASLGKTEEAKDCWEKVVSYNVPLSEIAKQNLQRLGTKQRRNKI